MLSSLAITLLVVLSAKGYGGLVFGLSQQKSKLFSLAVGILVLSATVYMVGLAGALNTPVLWGILIFGLAISFGQFILLQKKIRDLITESFKPDSFWFYFLTVSLITLCILALVGALTPPVARDSLVYHLALPKQYLVSGQWLEVPHNIYSYFPGLTEAIYTLVLGLGSQYPSLIHFGFGIACLAATYELGRILGLRKNIILVCILALLATPTFFLEMTWSYVDLATTFFWILTVLAFLRWTEEKKTYWLMMLGFSMGAAYGCKYTSLILFLVVPLGILVELWFVRTIKVHQIVKSVCMPISIVLLVSSPWWLKNIILTGNPFFPFFWDLFPSYSSEWDAERTNLYNILLARYGGIDKQLFDYIAAPFRVFTQAEINKPDFYDGKLGWYYLLALPVLFFWRFFTRKIYYLLGLVVIYVGYWSMTSQQARFLLVLLPILSLLVGYFLQNIWEYFSTKQNIVSNTLVRVGTSSAVVLIILFSIALNTWETVQVFKQEKYPDYFMGKISTEEYLQNKLNYYPMFEYINNKLPEDSYVLMVMTGNHGYYLERAFFSDSVFEDNTFRKIIAGAKSAAEIKKSLRSREWTHLLIRPDYFFSDKELSYGQDKLELLNDLFDNHLRIQFIHGQFWLFAIPPA
jgi:hypothetical protein